MSNQRSETNRRSALAIFPGALGDLVCFAPALAAIARRGGEPVLLASETLAPLVRAAGLARPLPLEGQAGAWLFSADPPPEADAFFGSFEPLECFTGSGVAEVERNVSGWGGRVHRFRPERRVHLAVHFLERVGLSTASLPEVQWRLPQEIRHRAAQRLPVRTNTEALLVVQPGSGGVRKRWSREGFGRVARRWVARGGAVVVVLGPAESGEARLWRTEGFPVVETPPLDELAGLLAEADVCLGNDSGTSHLAAAVGVPGVAVFGPTDENLWRPLSPRWQTIRPRRWSGVDEHPDDDAVEEIVRAVERAGCG